MEQNEDPPNAIGIIDAQERSHSEIDVPALSQQVLPAIVDEQPEPGQWLGTNASTLSAIERLDFDAFSQRKNRGLLELTRAMRLMQGVGRDPRVVPHLTRLRASLVRNQAALQIHLDAVREVSAIIAKSIQEVESDGTYSLVGSGR